MDNYESKYNDIINRLRKAKEDDSVNDDRYCCVIDDIVPELKESDDERIRKALINGFNKLDKSAVWYNGITNGQILAWLEKQCEQNLPIEKLPFEMKTVSESLGFTTQKECDDYNKMVTDHIMSDDGKGEQKPANKVEPKFKVGDWIYHEISGNTFHVNKIENDLYVSDEGATVPLGRQNDWRLWTLQDAKPGDVLCCESGWTCIFKTLVNDETFSSYCFMDNTKWFCETGSGCHTLKKEFEKAYNSKIYPATKEQRDLLFQKMKESGYEWDSEKLELIKIKQNVTSKFKIGDNIEPIDSCLGSPRTIYKICDGFYETNQGTLNFEFENNWRLIEQKSAWSEEDERNMGGIVSDLEYLKDKANAKTLKERFQDKIDWLKSLRQQNRWKPSESQLEALDDFIYAKYPNIEKYEASVKSLYQDLKKLKG